MQIRMIRESDAEAYLDLRKRTLEETQFMLREPDELKKTIEQIREEVWPCTKNKALRSKGQRGIHSSSTAGMSTNMRWQNSLSEHQVVSSSLSLFYIIV